MNSASVLPNCPFILNQGAAAARRRWPGVSGGLSLGRPARRTPGHTGCDPGSVRFPAIMQVLSAVFLALAWPARGYRVEAASHQGFGG